MKKENKPRANVQRNGKARKRRMQPVKFDRRSGWKRALQLMLMAFVVALTVEGLNQGSVGNMARYLMDRSFYFALNWLMILTTLCVSELVRHRKALSWTLSAIWVILGIVNYTVCRIRTQPLMGGDLRVTREMLGMITLYYSWPQIIGVFLAVVAVIAGVSWVFSNCAKCRRVKFARSLGAVTIMVCFTVFVSILSAKAGLFPKTISDRVAAYHDYGFATCFVYSFTSTGIDKPEEYSTETVEEILEEIETPPLEAEENVLPSFGEDDKLNRPNIVFLQLESFFDVDTVIGAEFSRDPIPNFHKLMQNWPTAELYVPTIGGGTANVEFEVMSGMNMDLFGSGETPYNTIIREMTCETIADILRKEDYYTTALHNNTGTFFNRNEVYANLGYDCFVPLEYMLYPKYNEVGWAHDDILIDEVLKVMQNSQKRDLVFAIAVESHGKYPTTYEPEAGDIEILSLPEDAYMAPFQNYVNVIPNVDSFLSSLIAEFERYNEPVLLILYGDHLPALGLDAGMLTTDDLYASRYIIWNNFGADFEAQDMQAYRLSAHLLEQLGISEGVMTKFHQSYPIDEEGEEYIEKLQTLEYDLLYGEQEAYGESGAYAPTDLKLGSEPIVIRSAELDYRRLLVTGENFTEYSCIVSGENVLDTVFIDAQHIAAYIGKEEDLLGESICIAQRNAAGEELGRTAEFADIRNDTGIPRE